ncbi:DNA topoisomerase IB [Sphingobium sufflavum]|uniref:DNA topoisomerase IB n=1 Tax=Sphingobium sufflavum TaxID=1129547 RepID=UPI001F29DA98|nr:DNA topoisomerase IB [Sphingobium sufflavum]MCE7795239.1 DNA topoisomerase IB [Sphingobium sufflavum]
MATRSPAHPSPLRFTDDSTPGIARRRKGQYFAFFTADGARVTDRAEIERLRAIGLPPAYERCWYCPDPDGHLQATGYDARGRKQYRYHPAYRETQDAGKYAGCAAFGHALPKIRARVEADLRQRSVSRDRALAALVRLLDIGMIRIGNDRYAQENKSYGATTLRMRHAAVEGGALRLCYRGKSGKMHERRVRDAGLTRFVRAMQDLPGQRLFQYVDQAGARHDVTSTDVNAYLHAHMGPDISAKHFRTWGGSVTAFAALWHGEGQMTLKTMLDEVAQALGNTPAISRKSYVHPALIDLARSGDQPAWRAAARLPRATRWLSREERGLIAFLEQAG